MEYTLKRLTTVVSSYIRRNILPGVKREFVIYDLTNSTLDRIQGDTPQESIISILGNDFADYCDKFLYTVQEYKQLDGDTKITKHPYRIKQFTYFWGIYNGKLKCGKLDDLPADMLVMPVRNWKRAYGKIISAGCDDNKVSLYFIDEFGNKIYYPQTGNNTKTLLIGSKHQLFLSCNPCWDMQEYSTILNKYLQNNPSYLVLLDNGRFERFQLKNVNKALYIESTFHDYEDMFVFGELK